MAQLAYIYKHMQILKGTALIKCDLQTKHNMYTPYMYIAENMSSISEEEQ